MNSNNFDCFRCFFLFIFCLSASSQQGKVSMKSVQDFFDGTWKVDGIGTYETWEVSGESLSGKGFKVKDGVEKITESIEIKSLDGKIYF